MNWEYQYFAKQATHMPTGLTFSVSYDPVLPEWKVRLDGHKPRKLSEAEVTALIQELDQLIRDLYVQRKMATLLHGEYGGDYARAAHILEGQTKKKVSTRTLQAWMMAPDRPSSRRCPEWALAALQQYLDLNPDASLSWREADQADRSTPEGRALLSETRFREHTTLKLAERNFAEDEAVRKKWRTSSLESLPDQLAELELTLRRRSEDHTALLAKIFACANSSTFEQFKRELEREILRKDELDRLVAGCMHDIRQKRREFASDDGTIPD